MLTSLGFDRAGLSKGLRGAIAQGHHKVGGTTLADFKMDILVAFFIFLKGTHILEHGGLDSLHLC